MRLTIFQFVLAFLFQITEDSTYEVQKEWNTLSSAGLTFFNRLAVVACFSPNKIELTLGPLNHCQCQFNVLKVRRKLDLSCF